MGASVSICNLTNLVLNVALIQVTPLYYQNQLAVEECATFHVGRVWFTVEASAWIDGHEYQTENDVVRPLLDMVFDTVKDASAIKDIDTTRGALNHLFDKMGNLTKKLPHIDRDLRDRKTGIYMNRDRRFKVIGGPNSSEVTWGNDGTQIINFSVDFDPIQLVELKDSN